MLNKEEIKKIFESGDLKILKSLGQNFLIDENVLEKIVKSADLKKDDFVFEIGPGLGTLTEELLKKCQKVIAIEKDKKLSEKLLKDFSNLDSKVKIINDDILKIKLEEFIKTYSSNGKYKLVSNIPYYITSPIIKMFLESDNQPEIIVLLMQKEVAERICAKAGKMSMIALGVQVYGEPEIIDYVENTSFYPVPKVGSAILKISNIKKSFSNEYYQQLFQVMKIGFSAKRKKLASNLSAGFRFSKTEGENVIIKANLNLNIRAQELELQDWEKLRKLLN